MINVISFVVSVFAISCGYLGKYGIAIFFDHYKHNYNNENKEIINNGTDNETLMNNFLSFSNDTNSSDINEKDIISDNELNKNIYISLIYISLIVISIAFFYSI